MQDHPAALSILDTVIAHLRERAMPGLEGRALFEMRVTISALELVRRDFALSPASDAAELIRLKALLGQDGDLAALNEALCAAIGAGKMNEKTPGLLEHMRQTSIEKLAVDQPNYSAYRRATQTT
jgi:hypothetical protein